MARYIVIFISVFLREQVSFRYSFVKVPRPEDSEVTFSVFESSCHLLLPV